MQFVPTKAAVADSEPDAKTQILRWLAIPLLALLGYGACLSFNFSGEDFVFIHFTAEGQPFYEHTQNQFFRPIPNLAWWLDYNLWGLNPMGYHLTNLLLHAANSLLVSLLAQVLAKNRRVALATGVLFALSPIHAEAVIWISGRPDLIAAFFSLLALVAGLYFFENRKLWLYLLSLLAFGGAIFSKESAITFPLVLLVIGWLANKPGARSKTVLLYLLPYGLVIGLYLALRIEVLGSVGGYNNNGRDLFFISWNGTLGSWIPLLFPLNLKSVGLIPALAIAALLASGYIGLGYLLWRQRSLQIRQILPALGLFYLSYLPALDTSPVTTDLLQSRNLYLPSAGFCLALGICFNWLQTRKATLPTLAVLISTVAGLALALLPWWQSGAVINDTIEQVKEANLPLSPGDTIYYEGLPDSYNGAYLWRNGLNEATQLVLQTGVSGYNRTASLKIDYRRADSGHIWFVRYALDKNVPALRRTFVYAVSQQDRQYASTESKSWDFSGCDTQGWEWEDSSRLSCENKRGFYYYLYGAKTTFSLESPGFESEASPLYLQMDVLTNYDFQQPQILSEIGLSEGDKMPDTYFNFDLSADGRYRRYFFILPDMPDHKNPLHLNLRINKCRNDILWQNFNLVNLPK
ncbi:MAG: glycosyltransferase family 39 protein [Chloroflexi bacterium]|uniref:Glycosyltransferase family 39 protein n=1 Tax=Candidatus Chlorohelix allophototropha TaxID=3003348 RepID=A0A8T7LV32_9CHLR|nr:glycosyltransferase family 39 protein [Chloroflexota bacterium]WJW66619.1 hypothetical protein OZ401_002426 [Chloroflexota bacterium L227-S17]